jgi:hypothetical protein
MKMTRIITRAALCAALATAATGTVSADQVASFATHDKKYTGTIVSVDAKGLSLAVKGPLFFRKTFNLGDACQYTLLGKDPATAADLRPGQRVRVRYQNAQGVLIADRVTQEPMKFVGRVQSLDPQKRTLIVRHRMLDKKFQVGSDCVVRLHDEKAGALTNVQPGEWVTVIFEEPGQVLTAREIDQTSLTFTGALTAIDLSERTVKAKGTFGTKKFSLADGCSIVVGGKLNSPLRDLKPGDQLTFNYDEVNGINIASRVAEAGPGGAPIATQAAR